MRTKTQMSQKTSNSTKADPVRSSRSFTHQHSHPVLQLHQQLGNQAVQRLLQSGHIQAKLTVGQPNDKYEQEADRVADQIMRMPDPAIQREIKDLDEDELEQGKIQAKPLATTITPIIQRLCQGREEALQRQPTKEIEKDEEDEEKKRLQAKEMPGQTPDVSHELEGTINSLRGGGQALSPSDRNFFEPRFAQDFSQVRIHYDPTAAKVARSINAKAFTTGKNILFGAGEYSPNTSEGKRLLAHELTHVLQQNNSQVIQRQRSTPRSDSLVKIDALFVGRMTWLALKMRDKAEAALLQLKGLHSKVGWQQQAAQFIVSIASAGLGVLIGGGVGGKIFSAIALSSASSFLSSSIKPQSLTISRFITKVKDQINDYLLAPKVGVLERLKAAKPEDKVELNKVVALLSKSKVKEIENISQELAMSAFLAGSKGALNISYRAYAPDLSKRSGNLSHKSLKWYKGLGRHVNFHVPGLQSLLSGTGYTKGMTYLESVYQGKKVRDVNLPDIRIGVSLRLPAKNISASDDYFHCAGHFYKGGNVKGCRTTGHMVLYSFSYFGGKLMTCRSGLCNSVKNYKQSVVDHNYLWSDSWFNYYYKSDVADKALAFALNETLPKPR
jgi:hypothetical protein